LVRGSPSQLERRAPFEGGSRGGGLEGPARREQSAEIGERVLDGSVSQGTQHRDVLGRGREVALEIEQLRVSRLRVANSAPPVQKAVAGIMGNSVGLSTE